MATKFITVSIEIMHDKNLNQSQKFILAEIEQLSQLDNGCFASNKHFSDLIGITKENVSRNINELEKMGYIAIEIKKGSRNHIRIITITEIVIPPYQNSKTPLLKQQETKGIKQSNKTNNKVSLLLPKSFNGFEYPKRFINLWELYNEGSKSEAYKAYVKIAKIVENEIVMLPELTKPLTAILDAENNKKEYKRHLSTILRLDIIAESERLKTIKKDSEMDGLLYKGNIYG